MSQPSVRQPAVAGPDAMDPSQLVIEYTLEALNHEGYINANVTDQIPTLENIAGDGASLRLWDRERLLATDPEGGEVGESQLGKGEPDHIHPTLQREQWIGIDERDWQAILPSIELASRFLDDPHIAPFFHGLDNATELKDPLLKAAYGDLKFHRFDSDNSVMSTDAGFTNALFAMMSMRDQVQLRFADEGRGHASTSWGAPEDWGVTWATQYPVSMDWCRNLFTKEYWEKVSRYGFIQVRPRRLKGVRLQVTSDPRPEVGDDTMSPKSRTLLKYREDRRIKAMKAGVKADDIDSSDEEDVDAQIIVVRGKHKKELEEELRKQREEDGHTEMPDA
ncbi:unnamed protein product [Aureobasidium pullulans]|nr:unnamed protein product [Aureobasidium pullulans]CAD0049858.1 unnamed protein product [Aureobasidium pullulans]